MNKMCRSLNAVSLTIRRNWTCHRTPVRQNKQHTSLWRHHTSSSGCDVRAVWRTCMPSRAKMTMKRKRRRRRLAMDRIELMRDATRLRSADQYLQQQQRQHNVISTLKVHKNKSAPFYCKIFYAPCKLEDSQESCTAKHGHAKRLHQASLSEDRLQNATQDDERVEAVEQRHKVALKIRRSQRHCHE